MVAMTVHGCPDIGAFDMNGGVEAIEGRDGKFASSFQGKEGTGETGSYGSVEQDLGINFSKECLYKRQHERFPLGMLRCGWGEISGHC